MSDRLWDLILAPEGLTTVFQPVFEVQGSRRSVYALEALTRGPRGTDVERSDILFDYVRRRRGEVAVDRLAIAASLRELRGLPAGPALSLNLHAASLECEPRLTAWLADMADEYTVPHERLIVEIVEHAPRWAGRQFHASLERLRRCGIRIALDDIGLGHSNFRMILDCHPDLLKIDRHFVTGVHADVERRAVLESVAALAERMGSRAVAEGVEDERDLAAVLETGIDLLQGFLLCRPAASKSLRKLDFMRALPQAEAAATGTASETPDTD